MLSFKEYIQEDKIKLAREIAKRSKPRFIEIARDKPRRSIEQAEADKRHHASQPSYWQGKRVEPPTSKKHWSEIERERLIKNWSR